MGQPDTSKEVGTIDPVEPKDAEKLTNVRNSSPSKEEHLGRATVGAGQPSAQVTKQEPSLPATAVPVEKNFSKTGEFYNPMDDEHALAQKDAAERGAKKAHE